MNAQYPPAGFNTGIRQNCPSGRVIARATQFTHFNDIWDVGDDGKEFLDGLVVIDGLSTRIHDAICIPKGGSIEIWAR